MTPAQEKGIVPGKLCRVVNLELSGNQSYCAKGMIVELDHDDGSSEPWFKYVSGPKGHCTDDTDNICISIHGLELLEEVVDNPPQPNDNTFLLNEYIRINYPKDAFLRILIDNLKGN